MPRRLLESGQAYEGWELVGEDIPFGRSANTGEVDCEGPQTCRVLEVEEMVGTCGGDAVVEVSGNGVLVVTCAVGHCA